MPRYYCDYCDTYLTHDSPSVRKQHNQGYKHKANVRTYYQQFEEQQTQSFIDQKVKEVLHMGGAFMLPGQYRPPVIRPLPVPGSNPSSMVPPGRPLMPGYMTPPTFRPPMAAPPQGNGLPLPPAGGPPPGAPGVRPSISATPPPNGNLPPSSVPFYQQAPPTSMPGSYYNLAPGAGPPGGYSQQQSSMNSISTSQGFGSAPPPGTLPPPPGNFPSSQTPPTSSSYGPPTVGGAPGYGS